MVALEEYRSSSLAACQKWRKGALATLTPTPKNRVWGFANAPSGRPSVDPELSWETATGSVQYTYENASGRAEFLTRDPLGFKAGPNMYTYVHQNPWTKFDPEGLDDNKQPLPPQPPPKDAKQPVSTKTASNTPPAPQTAQPNSKTSPITPPSNPQPTSAPAPASSAKTGPELTLTQGPGGVAGAGALGLGGFVSGSIQYGVIINTKNLLDSRFTLQIQGNVMTGVGIILTGGASQSYSVSGEKSKTGFSGEGAVHVEGGSEVPSLPVTGGGAIDIPFKTIGAVMTGKGLGNSSGGLGGDIKGKGTTREGVGGGAFVGAGVGYTESINSPTIGQMAKFLGGLF